ncbi:hypothetical protein A4D02_24790 [Niastella koreensis]|uniref:Secretion system C-terminal sorting domain-containing protein n=2 Tax=Niastella koreensis TaxID=354356 RepID=G8TFV3_NIAKG|nr:T9SS type A sorting domain-containing protein [Niastella koreensis]AEW00552.1 hypothetical protein Niako_4282 [Niastella koreensis GR20-10]OQP52408.1 hypothetical protein A4D02_24790 [Niastella koreensis]
MRITINYFLFFILTVSSLLAKAQAVKVQAATTISTTGGVVIGLHDMDLDVDGTINQLPADGSFSFTGNGNNYIRGLAVPRFDVLQIAKAANASVILQQNLQIGSGITFTGGLINLNTKNILLQPAALLNGESETSRITGSNGGYIEIVNTLNAPAGANPGNLGAAITSSQNLGAVTIRRGHQSQHNINGTGSSILRYYDILPGNNSALGATFRFNYFNAELNALDANLLTLWQSQDHQHWTDLGFSSRSTTSNYVEQAALGSLYRLTLTEVNNALPLIWSSFNTQCQGNQSTVSWKTLQEQNTASFTIRRSMNGRDWTSIGRLQAAGNSPITQLYTFIDQHPLAGSSYYQIVQQDLDGRETYSPVLVNRCELIESCNAWPNPVYSNCIVAIQSSVSYISTIRLYNSLGALLTQKVVTVQQGNNQFMVPMNNYLPGMYTMVIAGGNRRSTTIKIEKQ